MLLNGKFMKIVNNCVTIKRLYCLLDGGALRIFG